MLVRFRAEMAAEEGTGEELDVIGRDPSGNSGQDGGDGGGNAASSAPGSGEAQLLYLPVTVADIRAALQREQRHAEGEQPAQPPAQQGQQGGAEARQGDGGAGGQTSVGAGCLSCCGLACLRPWHQTDVR